MLVGAKESRTPQRLASVCLALVLAGCPVDDRAPGVSASGGAGGEAGLGPESGGASGIGASGASGNSAVSLGGAAGALGAGAGGVGSTAGSAGASGAGAAGPVGLDAGSSPDAASEPAVLLSGSLSSNFARTRVLSEQGKSYIVQNNNRNNPGAQRISYAGPSFTVVAQTSSSANGYPISFPSIYIGRNGDQSNGMTTSEDDNLPIQISQLTSIATTFTHNATTADADAVFELWFANQPPTGQYDSADAYVVVILHLPGGRAAEGVLLGVPRSIEGRTWRVWSGERAGAPVISYEAGPPSMTQGPLDLEPFVRDAAGFSAAIGNMYLTDVHAGFEIWSGGEGLSLTNLSIAVE